MPQSNTINNVSEEPEPMMWKKTNNVLSLLSFSADGSVRGGVPAGAFAGMCVSGGRVVREREKEICYLGSILQLSFVFFLAPGLRWFSFHCWDMLRRAEEHLHQTQIVAHNCIKLSGFQTKTPKSEVGNI